MLFIGLKSKNFSLVPLFAGERNDFEFCFVCVGKMFVSAITNGRKECYVSGNLTDSGAILSNLEQFDGIISNSLPFGPF